MIKRQAAHPRTARTRRTSRLGRFAPAAVCVHRHLSISMSRSAPLRKLTALMRGAPNVQVFPAPRCVQGVSSQRIPPDLMLIRIESDGFQNEVLPLCVMDAHGDHAIYRRHHKHAGTAPLRFEVQRIHKIMNEKRYLIDPSSRFHEVVFHHPDFSN